MTECRRRAVVYAVVLGLGLGFRATPTLAQSNDAARTAARALGAAGLEAYWADDFTTADEKLDRAYRMFATPTLGLWSARARVRRGLWVEAAERFREATLTSEAVGDSQAQRTAQLEANAELTQLLPRIPSVAIQLEHAAPSDVRVTLDDMTLEPAIVGSHRPTNPGTHRIVATRGKEHQEVVFELVEEQHQVVNLSFAPLVATAGGEIHRDAAPPEVKASALPAPTHASWELAAVGGAPSAFATASVFAMGLGGAGLLTGGITFAVALAKLEDCPGHKCKTEGDAVGYETLKTVSTVSFYAGAALAAGGLVLWLTKPAETRPSPSEVTWTVGPGSVSVQVGF